MIDKGRRGNEVRTHQVYGWCSGLGMLSRNKLDIIAISHSRQLHEQKSGPTSFLGPAETGSGGALTIAFSRGARIAGYSGGAATWHANEAFMVRDGEGSVWGMETGVPISFGLASCLFHSFCRFMPGTAMTAKLQIYRVQPPAAARQT